MKTKKLFILSSLIASTVLMASCNGNSGGPQSTGKIVGEEERLDFGGVHKYNITESNNVLIKNANVNASSDYKIVYDNDETNKSKSIKAAQFLQSNFLNSAGVNIPIEEFNGADNQKCTSDSHIIYVGCRSVFTDAGLTMPEDNLGLSGYYIKSKDKSLFIEVNTPSGFQTAVISLLKEILGFDYFHDDFIMYNKVKNGENVILNNIDIVEVPDFDNRNYVNNGSTEKLYANGYNTANEIFIPVGNNTMHNCNNWLPHDTYGGEHPYWYQDSPGQLGYQLCYTAHGDEDELELMLNTCLDVLETHYLQNPGAGNITLTQLDEHGACTCEACKAIENDAGAISATIIKFLNKLDNKFREKYPDAQLNILFFAYQTTLPAPTKDPTLDPSLKCNEHVFPIIAPIEASFTRSFYDDVNRQYADNFINWSKYTSKFCAWVYECNYKHYMYPYLSYQPMVDTYRFLKEVKTSIMYNEGQRYNTAIPCFGRFKDYIDSKLNFDVRVKYDDLKRTFFDNYYGDGGPFMEELFEKECSWTEYLERTYFNGREGYLYQEIDSREEFWPKPMLEGYLELCDKAFEAIAPLQNTNYSLYKAFYDHINIESMFPRFVLCDKYDYLYSPEDIYNLRIKFKEDCQYLGIQEHCEVHTSYAVGEQGWMSEKFTEWGI